MTPNATNYVTKARTGLWCTSPNEERWQISVYFADKRDAIAYGLDHCHRWIGRVVELTDDDVAAAFVRDGDEANEHLGLQDEWSWCEDRLVREPSDAAAQELHDLVRDWVERHHLRERTWRVDEAEKLQVEAAKYGISPPLPPGEAVAPDDAAVDLRPATAADLVRGAEVWYTPILGEQAFRGFVAWGSFKLTCGQVMADLFDMEPAYGQFVGLPPERRVYAARLEALFVRATPGGTA